MNPKPISEAQDPDLRLSQVALERAARRAHELAARTGTKIVISRNGIVEHVEPTLHLSRENELSALREDKNET